LSKVAQSFEVIHTHGLEIAQQEHPTLNTTLQLYFRNLFRVYCSALRLPSSSVCCFGVPAVWFDCMGTDSNTFHAMQTCWPPAWWSRLSL